MQRHGNRRGTQGFRRIGRSLRGSIDAGRNHRALQVEYVGMAEHRARRREPERGPRRLGLLQLEDPLRQFERNLQVVEGKAVTLQGTYGHNWKTWRSVLELLARGRVTTKPLISAVLPITEWEKGYWQVEDRSAVKVILKPVERE